MVRVQSEVKVLKRQKQRYRQGQGKREVNNTARVQNSLEITRGTLVGSTVKYKTNWQRSQGNMQPKYLRGTNGTGETHQGGAGNQDRQGGV